MRDATGCGDEYVAAKAFQIVMEGTRETLSNVPVVSYGNFLTADREEIERINAIRKLIIAYRENQQDKRPLSFAVFGPPGSGKSFSIKQLAEELDFAKDSMRTFNLSEFQGSEALENAFHDIRDATVKGSIPLIFWDEFDSDDLKWLKHFLAPMQDAEYRAGNALHPLGKAVFVFAGGVFHSFEDFERKTEEADGGHAEHDKNTAEENGVPLARYEGKKARDFISRLRGYLNIKGPNRQTNGDKNHEYLIRRAILLRSALERAYPNLLPDKGRMAVTAPLVQAFLRVTKYKHGARSLESLVAMSDVRKAPVFGAAALPPDHLLDLHVDAAEFRGIMRKATPDAPMIELIAEAYHEGWKKQKKADGYEYGPERSDVEPKFHPLMKKYEELNEAGKEGNRVTARLTQAKLAQVELELVPPPGGAITGLGLFEDSKDLLMRIEHDVWMREHLLKGYEHCENTEDTLMLHRCITGFDSLTDEKDKNLDRAIVESLQEVLEAKKYGVRKVKKAAAGKRKQNSSQVERKKTR